MKNKLQRGMTLVELLIVMVIVGVLSTIVLQSLGNSRTKAYDSKIKQQLRNFHAAADIYNNSQGDAYSATPLNDCTTPNTVFTDTDPSNGSPGLYLVFSGFPTTITYECNASPTEFAVQAKLMEANKYWCVDSRGISKERLVTLGSSTQCI